MKTLRQATVYGLIVLACMSSAAWQPEPASGLAESAVLIARGEALIDFEDPPLP